MIKLRLPSNTKENPVGVLFSINTRPLNTKKIKKPSKGVFLIFVFNGISLSKKINI